MDKAVVILMNWDQGVSAPLFILPASLIELPKVLDSKRLSWKKLPSHLEEVLVSALSFESPGISLLLQENSEV